MLLRYTGCVSVQSGHWFRRQPGDSVWIETDFLECGTSPKAGLDLNPAPFLFHDAGLTSIDFVSDSSSPADINISAVNQEGIIRANTKATHASRWTRDRINSCSLRRQFRSRSGSGQARAHARRN